MGETKKITTLNDLKQKNNIFWQIRNEAGEAEAELLLYGEIASSSWGDDEVTPKQFAEDLKALGGKDLKLRKPAASRRELSSARALPPAIRLYRIAEKIVF